MRFALGILTMFLATGSVVAQEKPQSATAILTTPLVNEGCPVNFSAQRRSGTELRWAKDSEAKISGTGMELTFIHKDASRIAKAQVTLRGWAGGPRVVPLSGNADDDAVELFQIQKGHDGRLRTAIWPRKMTYVQWVDLTQIEYTDGTIWNSSATSRCRVEPNRFLLVARP